MNWDRRAFVKFAVGAVVGLHASPLVPKLMDDSAIWTQNWSWVPTPEDGALGFADSVNPATGTGVRVRVIKGRLKGERLIKVDGNPEHPTSQGGVSPADASALQNLYYDEYRVKTPLIRDRKSGMYQEVSWDQALDVVAGKLAELHKAGEAASLATLGTDRRSVSSEILSRFMAAYGSPNLSFNVGAADTLALAGWAMFGEESIGFDLMGAGYVISFGTPLLEGFGSPVAVRKAFAGWRKDFKHTGTLVQVDSRASVTASQADTWLGCLPGSEAAVALGMCQVLMQEGLYDRSLAGCLGLEDGERGQGFKSLLAKNYTPKQVEALSGVAADKLTAVARAFAKHPAAVAVCGPGNGGEPGRLYDFMAVLALNALKGNLGKPGGLVTRQPLDLKPLGPAVAASYAKPRLDGLGGPQRPMGVPDHLGLARAALDGAPYKIKVALVVGGNPAFWGPQPNVVRDFLKSVPFVVAITSFMDETALLADVLLPAGTFLEAWGDSLTPYGGAVSEYGLHKPLLKAYPMVKAEGDAVLGLAAKLGGPVAAALPFASVDEALKVRTTGLGELAKLAEKGFAVQAKPAYGTFTCKTMSGKPEFFSMNLHNLLVKLAGDSAGLKKLLAGLGVQGNGAEVFMPRYQAPAALKQAGHGRLLLAATPSLRTPKGDEPITPYMIKVLGNDSLVNQTELVVEMNPQTAAGLHLKEMDLVTVSSDSGASQARVHLFAGVAPGVVFMPVGLGHTAVTNAYLNGRGGNYNQVAQATADPLSGLPVWSLTAVAVTKA